MRKLLLAACIGAHTFPMHSHSYKLADWYPFLPALSAGETLYSWCATFHRRACNGSALATGECLFGASHAGLMHDFPSHLGTLVERTGGQIGTARALALQHTLLGYFLPFLASVRAESLLMGVTVGAIPGLKARLGILASGIGGYHPLRCFSECIKEDQEKIGWPLWHLEHQLPSVLVCCKHVRPLIQYRHHITPVHPYTRTPVHPYTRTPPRMDTAKRGLDHRAIRNFRAQRYCAAGTHPASDYVS